ncbi:SPRY domain-containing protein [Rutstroemia sp. NJR-2017a BBW]|nr:SPRY domain-containing protein [Rutstroemia sp. NJR-2017a BBW]
MTNAYPSGTPGVPDSGMPTGAPGYMPRRSSYASVVSGAAPANSLQYQPSRSGAFAHLLNSNSHVMNQQHDPIYYDPNISYSNSRYYGYDDENGNNYHGRSGSGTRGGQLPSFSSAFGSLTNGPSYGGSGGGHTDYFFVPSYLRGSKYVQKLEEAHRAKAPVHKDGSAQSSQPNSLSTSASSINLQAKMVPSHRGRPYDLIEKTPSTEDEALPPLPTKWNTQDKYGALEVIGDGLEVKFTGSKSVNDRDYEACAIRADHPMPPQCGIYYFEVTIMSRKREESSIGIGFSSKAVPLSRLPGWEPESWAYHGDDGHSFCCQSSGKHYGPPFSTDDTIGCGVNFRTGAAFFTKNGDHLGTAFREIKGKLFPSVGMKKSGEHIRVNFGQSPFVYDIDGMMSVSNDSHSMFSAFTHPSIPVSIGSDAEETTPGQRFIEQELDILRKEAIVIGHWYLPHVPRSRLESIVRDHFSKEDALAIFHSLPRKHDIGRLMEDFAKELTQREKAHIRNEISSTSTVKLSPPLNETELIQSLVLQFLSHDGYVDTARAFAQEVHSEKSALNMDPRVAIPEFDVAEDEDAGHRQRIRMAILEGDIDKALKHTNAYYPQVLKDNEHVYFRLRCRKFVEMIRQGAELHNSNQSNNSKRSNVHSGDWYDDILNHDMELDDHQPQGNNWDRMETEESADNHMEYQNLLQETLLYGQFLQAEFKDDPRREVSKALEDAFSLMAYEDPLNAKEVAHLLDPSGRQAVAEELNSAILLSLGKSSSAALETVYQQTTVLLEDLRETGGPGAMVNIDEYIRPASNP